MQKFTRAITREVELAGERWALTLDATGISVRPVGSRKSPHTCSWASILCHLARQSGTASDPTAEEMAAAIAALRSGASSTRRESKEPAETGAAPADGAVAGAGAVPDLLDRLEKWLASHRPRFLRNLQPGASPEDLDALEKAVGVPLPPDLRALFSWHNGQGADFAGALEGSWLLLSTHEIQTAKKDLDAAAADSSGWRQEWVPFLDDDGGDFACVDTSQSGSPVREYWLGNAEHPVVAPSLAAWLETFVTAVERGDYVEDPERGRFLRRSTNS